MRNVTLLSFMICFLLPLSACFFKSDKTGTADDIISEMIYTSNAGPVLIAHEKVFHADSKSTGGGSTHISGYSNTRLSAYDLQTGQLLARSVLGKETEDGSMVLTLMKDQLWVLSKEDEGVQLHTYDPRTLALKAGTDELLQQAPFLKGHLANPELYQLKQYFGYDANYGIILSDDKGFRYTLDPATGKVEQFNKPDYMLFFLQDPPATAFRGVYDSAITLNLNGNPRKVLEQNDTPLPGNPAYLNGSFLIDNNVNRLKQQGIRPHHTPGKTDHLLLSAPDQFFMLQAGSINKDAPLVLSQLEWKPGQAIKERWQTPIDKMFFDPNNAREMNSFKFVFSSGNPQFGFKWADITGQHLVLTWMLHTSCIDLNTGKILWQIRH